VVAVRKYEPVKFKEINSCFRLLSIVVAGTLVQSGSALCDLDLHQSTPLFRVEKEASANSTPAWENEYLRF
jgi:hypothetical protein